METAFWHQVLKELKQHSVKIAPPGEEFTLASGEKSRFYIDVKKTAQRGHLHGALAWLLYDELAHGHFGAIEAVAGVALGGCHLASITALYAELRGQTNLNVIYVRKEGKDHGTKSMVEGPSGSQRVVLIEDVVTTGGSSLKAAKQLRDAGHTVAGILAVVDRRVRPTTTLEDLPLRSLYKLDYFEETAFEGPKQDRGVPPSVEEAVRRSRENTAEALATGKLCARCGMTPCVCQEPG